MKNKIKIIVAVGFAIFSCGPGRNSEKRAEISGAYAREYSFKVKNLESGDEIGIGTVRDTIFIRALETGYKVSNNKWRLNDYDKEGWQDMTHADDRPIATFQTTFNSGNDLLNSEAMPDLALDLEKGQLFKDKNHEKPYRKVK